MNKRSNNKDIQVILRFDHISYIADRSYKDTLLLMHGDPLFREISLKNLSIKNELMYYQHDDHDLYFYDNDLPVEYILYDKIHGQSSVNIRDNTIYGHYTNLYEAKRLLRRIFGDVIQERDGELICNMRGVLDKKDYYLVLKPAKKVLLPYLDDGGYGVAALILKGNYSYYDFDQNCCTRSEQITVNKRNLEICFVRSEFIDIIFELIWAV